jgi:cystathionine beta-lyase
MDFKTSSYVQDALAECVEHGIFGYSESRESYFQAAAGWMKKHFDWEVSPEWLVKTPGVVFALNTAVQAFTQPGDGVLIQPPVYYPFRQSIEQNGRVVVCNNLIYGADHRYHIDFQDFEQKLVQEKVKLFLLCNPHNPVGRVWTEEELLRMGELCRAHQVLVVSDEIHEDFVFQGRHHVFAGLRAYLADNSITCTAPSKTFNLAGLQVSNVFISNPKLRRAFRKQVRKNGYSNPNGLGIVACEAAYRHGEVWYQAMHDYVGENIAFTRNYVEKELPGIDMTESEGTYLVWLDFRGTGLSPEEINRKIIQEAKLWLDQGEMFGDSGRYFQRINVACPIVVLEEALKRLKRTFE